MIFPTETFYAIGCSALDTSAIRRIYSIKNRTHNKPFLLLVSDWEMLTDIIEPISKQQKLFLSNYWPGPLTVVFKVRKKLSKILNLNGNTLAFRITSSILAKQLIQISGVPIVGTSANISGTEILNNIEELQKLFKDNVDLYIDGGNTSAGLPSTVIEFSGEKGIKVLREGAILTENLNNHAEKIL